MAIHYTRKDLEDTCNLGGILENAVNAFLRSPSNDVQALSELIKASRHYENSIMDIVRKAKDRKIKKAKYI